MEIIPIIYTVLIIVFVITIFTIIFSSYSSRKKQKNIIEIPTSNSVQQKNYPIPNVHKNLKPISIQKPQKPVLSKKEKNIESTNKIETDIKKIKNDKLNKDNKKKLIRNSRIEVLNTLQSKNSTNNKKEQQIEQGLNLKSLGGNIIENYTDEEKNDMFTLKVKNQKDKPKNSK